MKGFILTGSGLRSLSSYLIVVIVIFIVLRTRGCHSKGNAEREDDLGETHCESLAGEELQKEFKTCSWTSECLIWGAKEDDSDGRVGLTKLATCLCIRIACATRIGSPIWNFAYHKDMPAF